MIFGKHINRYYLRFAPLLIGGLIALIVVDYFQLLIPNLYQLVINGINDGYVLMDGVQRSFDLSFVIEELCIPMLSFILIIVLGRFLWRICFFASGIRAEEDLRNRMFNRCKDLSQEFYHKNNVGNLMSLFTNDLDTFQECYSWGILEFFDATFLGGLAIFKMWQMDPMLTGLALIPMGFLMGSSILVGNYMTKKWDARQEAFSKLSDFAQESFSGIAVIKAFVKEGKELWAFKKLSKENEDTNVSFTKTSVLFRILVMSFVESVVCIILGYGGYLVHAGQFNAGQLMEFSGYFTAIIWPIMAVADLIDMTSRGRASVKRISELLDAKQDMVDRADVKPLTNIKGDIEFRNLNFCYPDGEFDALHNVSFTIRAGENIGLVGRTGSGKTTLVDLILRTYNVPDGTLFIDGQDVNTVPIKDVRAGCAYVPQDNFLFSDTIANNIGFAVDNKKGEAISNAAKMADVDGNIREFTQGYDTVLGERGVTVSGGQKQRISIARALLKDAPVLILDDSVSAVDTKTERTILENLRQTRAGRTTILIAHRISTIEQMDKVLFIDDGTVAAFGPHETLYETCPEYRKMVDLQRLEEEGGEHNG
ncbi:MAG: ABC transporter ATP-binding protein [Ruminococcaceae bacterium]|nr:ABC transporter ATP-binding protein [Oscillospiraceae bacterium]